MSIDDARIDTAQVAVGEWMRALGAGPIVASSIAIGIAALAREIARDEIAKLSEAQEAERRRRLEDSRRGRPGSEFFVNLGTSEEDMAQLNCPHCGGSGHVGDIAPTPPAATSDGGDALTFGYTNWRGEYSIRRARPIRVYFGNSDWHEGFQWFLRAFDIDKNGERDFALCAVVPEPTTKRIADLEQRLAETELTLETVTLSARQQEASPDLRQFSTQLAEAERQRDEATALVERLGKGLKDCIEDYEDAANYKDEYLRNKHGDAENIAKYRALLSEPQASEGRV